MGEVISVDITDKSCTWADYWLIIGMCPETVAASGGLRVFRGPDARVIDCESDQVIVKGRSLPDVLRKLADKSGLPVVLTDEETGQVRRFEPRPAGIGQPVAVSSLVGGR